MNKYTITSQKFTGQIDLMFDDKGTVCKLDLTCADLDATQLTYFVNHMPIYEGNLEKAFKGSNVVIVSEKYHITFDDFWNAYDQKHNRKRAEQIWNKLTKSDQVQAYCGLKSYDRHLKINSWKSKADPDTYLRNRMWENNYK